MKKTYIKPSTTLHAIKATQLICNSIRGVSGLDGVSTSNDNFVGGTSDSRSDNSWDIWGDGDYDD